MTVPARLPAGLEPWGEALSVLTPELASGLLPLLRGLDELIGRSDAGPGATGPLDGYDGLTTRGHPDRIVMSEWLLASELPLEFLRRAASGELLYLAPAFTRPRPRGRVTVLVDNGPEQLGAPRLVQLAALIVLHRRAAGRSAGLAVGVLGDEPGAWLEGDLRQLLPAWLKRRGRAQPTNAEVDQWQENLEPDAENWLLAGVELAAGLKGRRRVLGICEGDWGPDGITEMRAELGGDVIELPLPSRELSVRALRGAGFRRPDGLARAGRVGGMRDPAFNSRARQLLLRGEGASEILAVTVPGNRSGDAATVRRYSFPGPVVAAAYLGRRLVAVTLEGEELRVRVIGKPFARLAELIVPVEKTGATSAEIEAACGRGLAPLYLAAQDVICQVGGTWCQLSPAFCRRLPDAVVAPGDKLDLPRLVRRKSDGAWTGSGEFPGSLDTAAVLLGHGGWLAVRAEEGPWFPVRDGEFGPEIWYGAGDEVLALVTDDGEPKLVTLSPGGLIVRLVGASGVRTLTAWSGGPGRPVIHPTLPLIAVQRSPELIEIGDLLTGEVRQVVRSGP